MRIAIQIYLNKEPIHDKYPVSIYLYTIPRVEEYQQICKVTCAKVEYNMEYG